MNGNPKRTLLLLSGVLVTGTAHAQNVGAAMQSGMEARFTAVPEDTATPGTAPATVRLSSITLPFDAPSQTQAMTLAQNLPEGATLVPGSSRLDGRPVADPQRGPSGTYYWSLISSDVTNIKADNREARNRTSGERETESPVVRGVLTYDVSHAAGLGELPQPALKVNYSANRSEVLQGKMNASDFAASQKISVMPELSENAGAIKLPLADSVIRIRDRISVTVEAPKGDIPALTVNGTPVSPELIGMNTQDSARGIQRLTYVGVPIQSGHNILRFNGQEITVNRVGATSKIELIPVATVADGSTPVKLKVRTLDAAGQLTDQSTVTLRSNLEPRVADADTTESGYQIKLLNGEGMLELQPQAAPVTLRVGAVLGKDIEEHTFEIKPDQGRVGVGVVSVTAGLGSNFNVQNDVTWQAHGYYEGPLAGGKVYVAADKDRLPTDEDPLKRAPVYGDASVGTVPLQGIDPVAFSYDHPNFRAEYRQTAVPIDVLPVGEKLTALTAFSKSNPQISGFVAAVPNDHMTDLPLQPHGNRILRLPSGNVSDGSETLQLVTLERTTGKELKRTALVRNVDYVVDNSTGIITLARALDPVDLNLNKQVVYASYRIDNPMSKRDLAYGVQIKKSGEHYTAGVAAVSLDQVVTYGARATYDNGNTHADGLLAYSSGLQASASIVSAPNDRQLFSARLRYQQSAYAGLAPLSNGLSVNADYAVKLTDRVKGFVSGEYHNVPSAAVNPDPITGLVQQDSARGGSVSARAEYDFRPFTAGLGAKYAFGDIYGLGAIGSVGYHTDRTTVDVVHTQPLSGNLNATTDIATKFGVSKHVTLGFSDKITWGIGQAAALTLDSALGNVNYAVGYELPTAGGAGNRARFSVGTSLPLSRQLALGLRGSALYDVAKHSSQLGAGADLNYKTDTVSATVGTDLTYQAGQFGVVMRGGITGSLTEHLTLTADGLYEYAPAVDDLKGRNGTRLSLGYAYRARTLNSLGYLRYVNGTLAGDTPELSTGASAEYHQPGWSVRGGFDTRTLLSDRDSFTWQAYAGATVYVTDWLGLGAWGRMIDQPKVGNSATGYGVEANLRAMPGTWISAGYNFKGFDGLPTAGTYTKQGAYVRLDLTLDESLGRRK